jgi:hypothetical protein
MTLLKTLFYERGFSLGLVSMHVQRMTLLFINMLNFLETQILLQHTTILPQVEAKLKEHV